MKLKTIIALIIVTLIGITTFMLVQNPFSTRKNQLYKEKSPYLLQHKDNPVWWNAWGEDAFKKARSKNKPIFLSIGYSTCHWCHVMEHQSFEKQDVADILNEHFISIKVDREERPDVDKIYMDAVIAMTGSGGWPMSVFLTPDLKPFFGGTYFPKQNFIQLLNSIHKAWSENNDKVLESSKALTEHLMKTLGESSGKPSEEDLIAKSLSHFEKSFDSVHGGFGGAPKFPSTMRLDLLLRISKTVKNQKALTMVTKTLDSMAQGGIYDHLGGGFARYSTDEEWLVPHFEKMLYDNATLSLSYLEGYQVTKNEMYSDIATETLDYILRDMTHKEGGFYSAEDADSEGEEGKFYVWTNEELKKLLSQEELESFSKIYKDFLGSGNFEGLHYIFNLKENIAWGFRNSLKKTHQKLFNVREKRIHPYKDDKILTAWNGLMIKSMAKAYQVLGEQKYLIAAQNAALFIQKNLYKNKKLLRRYRDGDASINAFLDDYAFLIQALITLYQSDFDEKWMTWALDLQKIQDSLLWDEKNGGYFFNDAADSSLLRRSKDYQDGAKPNSNAVSALNLLKLYNYIFEESFKKKALTILKNGTQGMEQHPSSFSQMLIALDYSKSGSKEIAIIGEKDNKLTKDILSFLSKDFLPGKVVGLKDPSQTSQLPLLKDKTMLEGKTTVYVCENNTCSLPTNDLKEVKRQIYETK